MLRVSVSVIVKACQQSILLVAAPRSGKTTVVQELIKRKPVLAASTDAIRSIAKGMVTAEINPNLFRVARGTFGSDKHVREMRDNPKKSLEHELDGARETWKSVLDFIKDYQQDGKNVAVEGVAVLPEQLSKLDFDFKAVFFVNLSEQSDIILKHAKHNQNDWMRKYDENTIRLYCKLIQLWNQYCADEAKKYSLPVVTIDNDNFETSIQDAVKTLLT